MRFPTTAAETLRASRESLRISQSELARMSGVSRYKICLFELGDSALTAAEQDRIKSALAAETKRLRNVTIQVDFSESGSRSGVETPHA